MRRLFGRGAPEALVQRLEVGPGDIVVIKLSGRVSLQQMDAIRSQWREATGGQIRALGITDETKLSVLGRKGVWV